MLAALALLAAPAGAGRAQETHAYIVRLGRDTLALETVTRTPTQVSGEAIVRTPRNLHRDYVMDLAADGTVTSFALTTRPMGAPAGASETRSHIEFTGDS